MDGAIRNPATTRHWDIFRSPYMDPKMAQQCVIIVEAIVFVYTIPHFEIS